MEEQQKFNEILERGFQALVQQKDWKAAIAAFDEVLQPSTQNFNLHNDVISTALLGHMISTFNAEGFADAIVDARKLLKQLGGSSKTSISTELLTRNYLVRALMHEKSYEQANTEAKTLLDVTKTSECSAKLSTIASECVEKVEKCEKNNEILDDILEEIQKLSKQVDNVLMNEIPVDEHTKWLRKKEEEGDDLSKKLENSLKVETKESVEKIDDRISCTYCGITFNDKGELRLHCQTQEHQNVLMSDEGECFYSHWIFFS